MVGLDLKDVGFLKWDFFFPYLFLQRRTINLLWTSISVFQAWWTGANKMLRAVFCTEEQQPQMKDVKTSYVCNFLRFFVLFFGQNSAQFCRKQTADEPKPEFMVYM